MQSMATSGLRLYLSLEEAGVEMLLANSKKTRAIARAGLKIFALRRFNTGVVASEIKNRKILEKEGWLILIP